MKGRSNRFQWAVLSRYELTFFLLSAGTACLPVIGTPQAFSRTVVSIGGLRTLTFAERVAYQYVIEEVYWRHRIWPKDNLGSKPRLNAVISREQVETKVGDCLRNSQAFADYWQQPIAPGQLQGELDRIARHTRQPELLRELFEALGNDPFIIAECLARPILADRLVKELTRREGVKAFATGNASMLNTSISTTYPYKLPEITGPLDCTDDTWTGTTTVNAPDARFGHTAVWTGSEMIIWGGLDSSLNELNTGARYTPATDSWITTTTTNAPVARWLDSAVWTGSEMIVWGGGGSNGLLNTGGRYNPTADSWTPTGLTNVPAARNYHTAVWAGTEMIVWGGSGCSGNCVLNSGGRYNPETDSWTATSVLNTPSVRFSHAAVWTGSEMVIWGGTDAIPNHTYLHTGGRYNPTTDSWVPTSVANVPSGRIVQGTWTGSEMIIWGGIDESFNFTNTGGRYNPSMDNWTATSLDNAPSPRSSNSAVWTGSQMLIWGGYHNPPPDDLSTGGKYSPSDDSWTPTSSANVPLGRESHTAVWTGNEMVIWGGYNINSPDGALGTGGTYCAQPSTPIVQSVASRKTHGLAGAYDIVLPLNGTPAIECRSGGATNDYTVVITFLANVSVNGNPQAAVTSGSATIGSGGLSNGGRVTIAENVVTIPLTTVANAQTINITLYGVNGSTNFVIPMSVLIGDTNANGRVNASDVAQTKARIGQQVDGINYRSDVNANGYIDAVDVSILKSTLGTGLP